MAAAPVPESVVVQGVPEAPASLARDVAPYLEFGRSTFQDWHPRRRDLLITARLGETVQLHEIIAPGVRPRTLTREPGSVWGGSYDPGDGSTVVYRKDAAGREQEQWIRLDRDSGRVETLVEGVSGSGGPCWAPGGGRLAGIVPSARGEGSELCVIGVRPARSMRRVADLPGSGWWVLDWSPDGRRVLLAAVVSVRDISLHAVDVATGQRRRLTPEAQGPVAYAGGRFLGADDGLLVVTDRDSEFRRLAWLDTATGEIRPLGGDARGDVESFDLSRDGRRIAWFSNEDGVSVLRVIDWPSGSERRVPELPEGVASGLRWHVNGRDLAFTLSGAGLPAEVFSVDVRVHTLTRWTEGRVAGVNPARFARPERIRTRAADGVELSGLVYRPDPARFPGRRPVLMMLHGGPESQARPEFQGRWNFLIEERGVALVQPNVRGSSGYGTAFVALDDGRRREDAVRDVGVFLDWIGAQPDLDPSRVGVYGESYGGYLALASLIHHGERLRCGASVSGISHFPAFLRETSDGRRDLRRVEYGDERDPAMAAFLEGISPLNRVERLRRPLFLAHGANDPRVPRSEADRMAAALRAQGGVVWSMMAEDEGHGFARRQNSDFFFRTLVQFLEAWL